MGQRWKMNRIGFVNFWLYDEEEFEFCDGKLLLRGQNGSGKSITTQSFIPFILDGDRTPSRLDPFGSADRRMEYYFLGEEGKEESTGYLFLEFKKQDKEEYRTIGIGQRAKRGKPMEFWGFVILDGRRVGYDLYLYKQTGSTKIPFDKKEMRNELGENNLFTDNQSEYKKLVNKHIFGFRKPEQYEQFIKLLIKIRAPKLSKEFKPTKVYEILNESLQTLSDEDLYTMVDAMEKMDEIQDSLDMLNRAFSDAKVIRNEYTRYNQYMLAKKAQAYLQKKEESETAQRKFDDMQREEERLLSELKNLYASLKQLDEEEKIAETERAGLLDTDLAEIDHKLTRIREERKNAEDKIRQLNEKENDYQSRIYRCEQDLKEIERQREMYIDALKNHKEQLEEYRESLRLEEHKEILKAIEDGYCEESDEISLRLIAYRKQLETCRKILHEYEKIVQKHDEIAEKFDGISRKRREKERELSSAEHKLTDSRDQWIMQLFSCAENSESWKPAKDTLKHAENLIKSYQGIADAGIIREIFREDYETQRNSILEKKQTAAQELVGCLEMQATLKQELEKLQRLEEIEPKRSDDVSNTRRQLADAGIQALPLYKAVEFAETTDDAERAQLEAQLEKAGLLDALVLAERDYNTVSKKYPDFLDAVIYTPARGKSNFSKLVCSPDLPSEMKESVQKILSNIYEEAGNAGGIFIGEKGEFLHGMLAGRTRKAEAEFLGYRARKKKKEAEEKRLRDEIDQNEGLLRDIHERLENAENCLKTLEEEYKSIPNFEETDAALEQLKKCENELAYISEEYSKIAELESECAKEKQAGYQQVIRHCRTLPYGRTEETYAEIIAELDEYRNIWVKCRELLLKAENTRAELITKQEYHDRDEQELDDLFTEERTWNIKVKECDVQIKQYEEYLSRPDIAAKAQRLAELQSILRELKEKKDETKAQSIRADEKANALKESLPQMKQALESIVAQERYLCRLFEEELSLELLIERHERNLSECAKEALRLLRDSDKNREYGDLLQSLNQTYQKHNGNLIKYGTSLEECFNAEDDDFCVSMEQQPLRKRVQVVSTWNGKKVFMEEFYRLLKSSIDETELLIQRKDRELFEDILSQTISRQLTDRIAESRNWVKDMSKMMNSLDTSMGLSFSLEWKPRNAESDAELDTQELEQILLRDNELLTTKDIEKVASHFRSKIRTEKMKLEESGGMINYMELVRDALDYRKWFEFHMFYKRGEEHKKPLTNAAFNRFSGGEKAMAMYVPLFAAVNAQYRKSDYDEHPRIIALDEAFAGVDDKNISSMFELVQELDFDYIMNSQSLWGCYETVKAIRIAELYRPMNAQIVTVIRYTWNGHERILDVQ